MIPDERLADLDPELRETILAARERVMAAVVGGGRVGRGNLSAVTRKRKRAVRRALRRLRLEDYDG